MKQSHLEMDDLVGGTSMTFSETTNGGFAEPWENPKVDSGDLLKPEFDGCYDL